jgi:hypothetical protein
MPVEGRSLASDKLDEEGEDRRIGMSLATPEKIRNLQRKLYSKARTNAAHLP